MKTCLLMRRSCGNNSLRTKKARPATPRARIPDALAGLVAVVVGIILVCSTKCCALRKKYQLQDKIKQQNDAAVVDEMQYNPEDDVDIFDAQTPKAMKKRQEDDVIDSHRAQPVANDTTSKLKTKA